MGLQKQNCNFFIRLLLLGFGIWLAGFGIFPAVVYAESPKIVYISADYAAGNAGGHSFSVDAFAKIQDGVNAVISGGEVIIAAGTYDEQVKIEGKSLTLKGAGDATIILPSGPDKLTSFYVYPENSPMYPGIAAAGIVMIRGVGSAGVRVENLKIDGGNIMKMPTGVERLVGLFYAETGGTIQNVTVNSIAPGGVSARSYGIDVFAVDTPVAVEIVGNRVTDFLSNGIRAIGSNLTVDIRNNSITGPEINPAVSQRTTNGIGLVYGIKGRVSGNTIRRLHSPNNGWSSSGIILYGDGFKQVVVEENEIFDTDYGISLSHGANDSTIEKNYFHDNKTGIMLESGATNNQITRNTIRNNIQGFQIHGQKSSNPTGNKPPGAGNTAFNNIVADNVAGVASFDDTQSFDVRNNWWGSESPDFAKLMIGSVLCDPWLKSEPTLVGLPTEASAQASATANKPLITTQPSPAPLPVETPKAPPTVPPKKVEDGLEKNAEKISDDKSLLESAGQAGGPAELFDIRLLFVQNEAPRAGDLTVHATFDSYGQVSISSEGTRGKPTPVEMTYSIIDQSGNELWQDVAIEVVETHAVFSKRLPDITLSNGSYKLRLKTLYNVNVEDLFEKTFVIIAPQQREFDRTSFLFVLSAPIIAAIIFFIGKRLLSLRKTNK